MKNYTKIDKSDIPCMAHHKGLSYEKVRIVSYHENKVFYVYNGSLLRKHSRWENINSFVKEV